MAILEFKDLRAEIQLLLYLKGSLELEPNAIFCTCDKILHVAAEALILKKLVVEVGEPGVSDRAFALTDAGKIHMNVR